LAVYQLAAVVSRPIWGWLADKWLSAKFLLAWQGFIMGAAAVLAGQFTESWTHVVVLVLCAVAGATASGFTGLAYAEWARLGGAQRTEATGLGSGLMFAGVLLLPSLFSVAVTYFDDFGLAYACVGGLAALSGFLLLQKPTSTDNS
jgi:MFS family permease